MTSASADAPAEARRIRLVLVDDHEVVLDALIDALEDEHDLHVVGRASGGREALAVVLETRPDVALLDLDMPDMDGIAVTRQLGRVAPQVRVVIHTVYDDEGVTRASLEAGAWGYVPKGSGRGALIAAVRSVARGHLWFPGAGPDEGAPPGDRESLSERPGDAPTQSS